MPHKLDELNWMEFQELVPKKIQTVIIPVGTIEAHGVISLGTDTHIAIKLCQMIADDLKAILAPPIYYGVTRTLYSYPGSLTVKSETFQAYMTELFESLVDKGFSRIVVINGHGGNIDELDKAGLKINQTTKAKVAVVHWWIFCEDITKELYDQPGGHGGVDETAAILAIDKKLVKKQRYKKEMAFIYQKGLRAYPGPATIFLSPEGQGYPNFDEKKAKLFLKRSADKIKKTLLDIFKRWKRV
ncbi:MAG: creatininase family protein [Candidatus Zixiibacteriota bacterium]